MPRIKISIDPIMNLVLGIFIELLWIPSFFLKNNDIAIIHITMAMIFCSMSSLMSKTSLAPINDPIIVNKTNIIIDL